MKNSWMMSRLALLFLSTVGLTSAQQARAVTLVSDNLSGTAVDTAAAGWLAINNEASAGVGNGFYDGGVYQYPLAMADGGTGEDPLALVREFAGSEQFDLADYKNISMEWTEVFSGGGGTRMALKVDGTWYFSNSNLAASPLAFDPSAAAWTEMNLDVPGETVAVAAAAAGPLSGVVQGYGFFDQAADADGGKDFGSIAIVGDPVPEPKSLALLLLGLAVAGRTIRKNA